MLLDPLRDLRINLLACMTKVHHPVIGNYVKRIMLHWERGGLGPIGDCLDTEQIG